MRFWFPIGKLLLAVCAFFAGLPAHAQSERILEFHSDVTLEEDSSLRVTETITVVSAGGQIRHGIYRDFPTHYSDLSPAPFPHLHRRPARVGVVAAAGTGAGAAVVVVEGGR